MNFAKIREIFTIPRNNVGQIISQLPIVGGISQIKSHQEKTLYIFVLILQEAEKRLRILHLSQNFFFFSSLLEKQLISIKFCQRLRKMAVQTIESRSFVRWVRELGEIHCSIRSWENSFEIYKKKWPWETLKNSELRTQNSQRLSSNFKYQNLVKVNLK